MARNKVIIAGVGRSGTSFLFQEVAAALNAQGPSGFHYEPYLWAPRKVNETGRIETEPFDTRNLSPFGIYVHCASPLFLTGSHPVHDQMVERILGGERHVMAKMIRGNGRIQAYLRADPEHVGWAGSAGRVLRVYSPTTDKKGELIEGSPKACVQELLGRFGDRLGAMMSKDLGEKD